jgi:hypothetical protein
VGFGGGSDSSEIEGGVGVAGAADATRVSRASGEEDSMSWWGGGGARVAR